MKNPEVRKGDKIILKKSINGYNQFEGYVLDVISPNNPNRQSITAKCSNNEITGTVVIYTNSNVGDVYVMADRKQQANYLKEKNEELKKQVKENTEEIRRLDEFESEEEYVAFKIDLLMKTKGVKAKAQILKELKSSNFL